MTTKKQEVYQSSTLGAIPLSFTGRRLLQNLREEIDDYVNCRDNPIDWEPLSRARGKLALYISQLEQAKPDLYNVSDEALVEEIQRRFYRARGGDL